MLNIRQQSLFVIEDCIYEISIKPRDMKRMLEGYRFLPATGDYRRIDRNSIEDLSKHELSQSFSIQPENELLAYMRKSKRFKYKDSRRPLCDVPIMGDIYSITKELSEAYEEGCYNAYYNGHHQCVIWED